ncbi:cholinesterase 1-like [Actinia tenebrosa]|uniref:Cholinesterase 1-like n=1 Tax=Actinia tenebrosa TaxID=6105 RepID=A0A6P8HYP5_ACTTE|nr:cholinesterase 1-like [Actinia tenebrosa]
MKSYTYRALLASLLAAQVVQVFGFGGRNVSRVLTKQGYVRGKRTALHCQEGDIKPIYKFLGIPFAQAPNGTLRFKPPQPLTIRRSSEYDATYYRPICAQSGLDIERIKGGRPDFDKAKDVSEDCLYLNIYTPFINGPKKYPVIVFIHGGKFKSGYSTFDDVPGEYLPIRDVVLVTIQYRVGPFGFFTTGDSEAPGNMGLLDQVEALKWVQQNIEGFCGDKKSVTLLGESAGGSSVGLHYLSPLSRGLFHRGIAVSGVDVEVGPLYFKPKSEVEEASKQLITKMKCNERLDQVQCLQSHSWYDILSNTSLDSISSPIVDKHFLLDIPLKLRGDGKFKTIPFMAGFTSDEGRQFVDVIKLQIPQSGNKGFEIDSLNKFQNALRFALKQRLKVKKKAQLRFFVQEISEKYLRQSSQVSLSKSEYERVLVDIFTDIVVAAPTHAALTFHSKHGAPTYMFEFAHGHRKTEAPEEWMGPTHGDTEAYEFGKPFLKPGGYDKDDRTVSDIMVTMFINFAKFGNPTPNPVHGVKWQTFDLTNKDYLRIQVNPDMFSNYRPEKMKFWNQNFTQWLKDSTRINRQRLHSTEQITVS